MPAGLPAAAELVGAIAAVAVSSRAWREVVGDLAQPAGPMRFETAMEWLSESMDEDLSVLGFLDLARPGPLHAAFALAGLSGARLVTVNFDDLAELAIREAGGMPWTVDAQAGEKAAPAGTCGVLKLHGTRRRHRRARVGHAGRPLHATIREIVRGGGGAGLPDRVAKQLAEAVDGRDLVVVGYSASDDLDVVPALRERRPRSVTWIQHAPADPAEPAPVERAADGVRHLLLHWRDAGAAVLYVEGDTAAALREKGFAVPAPLPDDQWRARRDAWRAALRAWAAGVRRHDPSGLGWVSLCLGSVAMRARSLEAVRRSVPSPDPDGLWSRQRRLYELAQGTYLQPGADLAQVRRLGARARRAARENGDGRAQADAEMIIARALVLEDRLDEAAGALDAAARALDALPGDAQRDDWGRAYLAQLRARLGMLRGDDEPARAAAHEAARRFDRLGAWSDLCEALQVAAQIAWIADEYEESLALLGRAVDIGRLGPYPDQLETALRRRAMVAYDRGDVAAAYEDARAATELAVENDLIEEIAEPLTTWGTCAGELGRHDEAREALRRAMESGAAARPELAPDAVLGAADALTHLGRCSEALDVLDSHAAVAGGEWDRAHAAVLRWRCGARPRAVAEAAIAVALDGDEPIRPRPALCAVRLRPAGSAGDDLVRALRELTAGTPHEARVRRAEEQWRR